MIEKYSVYNILNEWKNNKLLHKQDKIERYTHNSDNEDVDSSCDSSCDESSSCNKIMGLEIGLFIIVSIIMLSIWFLAAWSIWRYWDKLPEWARIVSLIFLLSPQSGGPLLTLLVVFFSKIN